jgi:hypothetical protein
LLNEANATSISCPPALFTLCASERTPKRSFIVVNGEENLRSKKNLGGKRNHFLESDQGTSRYRNWAAKRLFHTRSKTAHDPHRTAHNDRNGRQEIVQRTTGWRSLMFADATRVGASETDALRRAAQERPKRHAAGPALGWETSRDSGEGSQVFI